MKHTQRFVLALFCLLALAPTAPAQTQGVDETTQRILALESAGRARPVEAAAELEKLHAATAEISPQRLELLTAQGLMLAVALRPDAAEAAAGTLQQTLGPEAQDGLRAA